MGTRAPRRPTHEEATFQKLAEDLRLKTSPQTISRCLTALKEGLDDRHTAGHRTRIFLQAGGLRPLISHLMATTKNSKTHDPCIDPSDLSDEAARALSRVLAQDEITSELRVAKGLVPPLIEALGGAPATTARTCAAFGLALLAEDQPGERRAMLEAGVLELVFGLYDTLAEAAWLTNIECQAAVLVCELVCTKAVKARELERAIRGAGAVGTFSAMVLLQDCLIHREDALVGSLVDAGVIRAVVDTLEHKSPFCVAAAAAVLGSIARAPGGGGQVLLPACGAVPALLRVIAKRLPIGDGNLYPLAHFKVVLTDQNEVIGFDDPTPVAIASLYSVSDSNAMLDSFLGANGIPVVLKLLRETTCHVTLAHTVDLLVRTVSMTGRPNTPNRCQELADRLHHGGLCEAVLQAMKKRTKGAGGRLLMLLFEWVGSLSTNLQPTAKEAMLAGNVVELAIDHMANAKIDMRQNGLGLLLNFLQNTRGRERICARKLMHPLAKGLSRWLPKAEAELIIVASMIARDLFDSSPDFIAASAKADVTAGLVCVLHKLKAVPHRRGEPPLEVNAAIHACLSCLMELLVLHMDDAQGPRKSAVEAGIIPLFIDLLALRHEPTIYLVLRLIFPVLVPADRGEVQQWAGGLLRAVSELLIARPPIAPERAADALFQLGAVHRPLIADYRSWGIDASVQRLKRHSDLETAEAAAKLLFLVNEGMHLSGTDLVARMVAAGLEPPDFLTPEEPYPPARASSNRYSNRQPTGRGPNLHRGPNPRAVRSSEPSAAGPVSPGVTGMPGPHAARAVPRDGPEGIHVPGQHATPPVARVAHGSPDGGQPSGAAAGSERGDGTSRGVSTRRRRAEPRVQACACCRKTAEATQAGKLLSCTACRRVQYCGRECQKADWPAHKETCKRMQAARA